MSWLSDRTGIHINSINDITSGRAAKEALHNPLVDAGLALAIPGVGGLVGKGIGAVAGAIGHGSGGTATGTDATDASGGKEQSLMQDALHFGGDLVGFLNKHKEDALMAFNVWQAAQRQGQADKYAQTAWDTANKAYNDKAPLRVAGQAGMMSAGLANPFARPGLAAAAPPTVTPVGGPSPFPGGGAIPWHGSTPAPAPATPPQTPQSGGGLLGRLAAPGVPVAPVDPRRQFAQASSPLPVAGA